MCLSKMTYMKNKTMNWLKVDSAFHPSEGDQMSAKNSWKLCGKK